MNTREEQAPQTSPSITIPLSLYEVLADWTRTMERFRRTHAAYARCRVSRGQVVVASDAASVAHERALSALNAYRHGHLGVAEEVTIATGLFEVMRRAVGAEQAYRLAVAGGAAVDAQARESARSLALVTQLSASDLLRWAAADECVVSR